MFLYRNKYQIGLVSFQNQQTVALQYGWGEFFLERRQYP